MALTLDAVARVLAALTLGACHVYDDACATPRDNPAGGVTVRIRELDDIDGGEPE